MVSTNYRGILHLGILVKSGRLNLDLSMNSTAFEDLAASLQCCSPGNVEKVTPHLSPSLLNFFFFFHLFLPVFLSGFPFIPFSAARLCCSVGCSRGKSLWWHSQRDLTLRAALGRAEWGTDPGWRVKFDIILAWLLSFKASPTACIYMVPNQIYLCFQSFYLINPFSFYFTPALTLSPPFRLKRSRDKTVA